MGTFPPLPLAGYGVLEDVEAFLEPHPIDLLPVSSKVKSEMCRLGMNTMGESHHVESSCSRTGSVWLAAVTSTRILRLNVNRGLNGPVPL